MLPRLARLVIAAITICAFLGAGLVQNLPSAQADTAGMTMMADMGDDGAAMPCHDTRTPPCQDKVPGCMIDLGCLFVVGIPVPPAPAVSVPAWSWVAYWQSVRLFEGVSPEPYLGPPIRLV
ncbi:hypothetical protein [Siccirubricoccus phaeus]|uniref:hypothetical protein n=1 Tax=Siccirubricoccus phaeus TaxID=2595053 RepID=UPI0011F3CA9C|nr:hypothetical protein [Siccirubricoccus phaeus]